MKKTYSFVTSYPLDKPPINLRELLKAYLIPKKWIHFLRINKAVLVNGAYQNFNTQVLPGDQLKLTFTEEMSSQQFYPASGKLPDIVYEDENILVINKPAGQKTHPNRFDEKNTAINDAATYLAQTEQNPFITHRLDMLTSGLLLFAKNPVVVPILNRQLVNKTMKRFYRAQVNLLKPLPNLAGTIDLPIASDPTDIRKQFISPTGLKAITHYQVLAQTDNIAELSLNLETGRTHQIRVHLAAINAPIIADPLYNPLYFDKPTTKIFLQAEEIHLTLPFTFQQKIIKLKDHT